MQDFESQLDLRQIMRTQFDLQLIIKLLMREQQRVLFKHQLSRLISNTGERLEKSESDCDSDAQAMKRLASTEDLVEALQSFKAKSELDKKLLKGVFMRDIDISGIEARRNSDVIVSQSSTPHRDIQT